MKNNISFASNATTGEAFRYIAIYLWVIIRNAGRYINRVVHHYPWAALIATHIIAIVVSLTIIGQARAERDSYNQQLVHTQQLLQSAQAAEEE